MSPSRAVPLYLAVTGLLLTASILIAGEAGRRGAPGLWLLSVAMTAAGAIELAVAARAGQLHGPWAGRAGYAIVSAALMAAALALVWLAAPHAGAGYVAFVHAFPILLTWAMARLLGLEPASRPRLVAVLLGLAGGAVLGGAKLAAAPAGAARWTLVATAIPVVLALGNIYRSRYWPRGAPPLMLAGLTLLLAGLMVAPGAALTEGAAALPRLAAPEVWPLLAALTASYTVQYVTFFRLQQVGGPVVLSLIGPVAAVAGPPAAVLLQGEHLPAVFPLAALLTGAGVWLMLRRT